MSRSNLEFLFVEDLAHLLRITPPAVRKRLRLGKIPGGFLDGKRWVVRLVTFERWLEARESGADDWRPGDGTA